MITLDKNTLHTPIYIMGQFQQMHSHLDDGREFVFWHFVRLHLTENGEENFHCVR